MRSNLAWCGLCLVAVTACGTVRGSAPEGFAVYEPAAESFRAVSSSGVTYRVRHVDHEPRAELKFWREAMKKRMTDAGYVFQREGELEGAIMKGTLLEVAAPLGQQDYAYLIAVFDAGPKLVIVESAGEVTKLTAAREAVLAAMRATPLP